MALTQSTRDVVNVADITVAIRNDSTAGGVMSYLSTYMAPLASPALTGAPTAPTAATGSPNTQIATTAYVANFVNNGFSAGGNISLVNTGPTFSLIDTDAMSVFLHNNSNYFYILRNGTTGAVSWDSGPNGRHPMTMNLANGDVTFSGNVGAYSDIRLKKNINTISDALATVNQLRGVTYQAKESGDSNFGFIAQEVEEIFPLAVKTDRDGYKSVSYANMTALLVEAVKDLTLELGLVRDELNTLKASIKGN